MKIEDNVLILSRAELLGIIHNNPEKSPRNLDIEKTLSDIVFKTHYFSEKQYNWILSKVKYVLNRNKEYRKSHGLSNERITDFRLWPDLWPVYI
jgi:hypothetical protein